MGFTRAHNSLLCLAGAHVVPSLHRQEELANIGEPIYVSFAMPVAAALLVGIGQRLRPMGGAIIMTALLCGVAVTTFFLVPMKPE